VYRNDNGGQQALSNANVRILFDEVNRHFANNNTGIQFYLKCSIEYINSTKFNTIDSTNEFNEMLETYYEPFALNWHLVRILPWSGAAYYPWQTYSFCMGVEFNGILDDFNIATTVHEVGHTLGLSHTHDNIRQSGDYNGDASNCYQESVSRTMTQGIGCISTIGVRKCEINGDALCDTEAAPNRASNTHIAVNNNCNYSGTGTDNWGDTWRPQTNNYMAYVANQSFWFFDEPCRNSFTLGQIAVMQITVMNYMRYGTTPWYNLHSISLSGTVYSGENETIIISHHITAPGTNSPTSAYTINSGATTNLFAGESITLKPGFHAKEGSAFSAKSGPLTGCSNVYPLYGHRGDTHTVSDGSLSQEDIDECLEIIRKALNREYMNYSKENEEDIFQEDHQESPIAEPFSFSIFPNPANGFVTVDYTLYVDAPICVELYNLLGQRLKLILPQQNQKSGNYSVQTSVSDLGAGAYLIKITSGEHIETKQLIVN